MRILAIAIAGLLSLSSAHAQFGQFYLGGSAPVSSTTTWNPSDTVQANLSGGNLTAAQTNTPGDGGSRSIANDGSGKRCFEFQWVTVAGFDTGIGIANASATFPGLGNNATNGAIYFRQGSIYIGGSNIQSMDVSSAGDYVMTCVNFSSQLIWWRNRHSGASGNWNANPSADPASGTGGLSFSFSGNYYAAVVLTGSTTDSGTANFGATSFQNPLPSGFTAGP